MDEIKDKAIQWAKRVLLVYGVAVTIFFAAFSLFGYKEIGDVKKISKELKEDFKETERKMEDVENSVQSQKEELFLNLENQISKAGDEFKRMSLQMEGLVLGIQDEQTRLTKLNIDVEKINFHDLEAEINVHKEELFEKIKVVEVLNTKLGQKIEEVELITKNVSSLKNSLFEIAIHFETKDTKDENDLKWLVKELSDEGFFINDAKVSKISANQSEVIYYHISARNEAEFIVNILEERFNRITSRFFDRKERNPKAILIKLDPSR